MSEPGAAELLDRALTVGGIGRTSTGELSPVSKGIYAGEAAKAVAWKRNVLRSTGRTFTPEQVAQYAIWLREQGYARASIGLAVRAIRWYHRVAGEPVPDGFPATYVLRGGDSNASDHGRVNDHDSPARHDPTELLSAFASACRPRSPKGDRDLCLVTMIYATGLPTDALVALDIGDVAEVEQPGDGVRLPRDLRRGYRVTSGARVHELRHGDERTHEPGVCAACAVRRWLVELGSQGIGRGALFRSIDRGGNIAGTTVAKGGRATAGDGRLLARGVAQKVLRPLAADAGLLGVLVSPARALRLAGAAAAYCAGELTLDQAAQRAGYKPDSALLLSHLLELTNPREDTPQ